MSVLDFYSEAFPPDPVDSNPLRFDARAFQQQMEEEPIITTGSPEPKTWSEQPRAWPGPGKGASGESSN